MDFPVGNNTEFVTDTGTAFHGIYCGGAMYSWLLPGICLWLLKLCFNVGNFLWCFANLCELDMMIIACDYRSLNLVRREIIIPITNPNLLPLKNCLCHLL